VICLLRFIFLINRFRKWWSLQIWLLIDLFDWSFKNELSTVSLCLYIILFIWDKISTLFFMLLNKFVSIIHESRLSFLSKKMNEFFHVKIRSESNSSNDQKKHSNHRLIVKRSTILDELWDVIEVILWNQKWWTLKQKITLYVRWNWKAKDINYYVHKMKLLTQSVLSRSFYRFIKRYEDFSNNQTVEKYEDFRRMKHWHRKWSE
jgi:hypothetical protein